MTADAATATLPADFSIDPSKLEKHQRRLTNPWLMRAFLIAKLPLGFIAGLRVQSMDEARCQTTVPYGWRTQNPFRSTYFAAQAMAAELSTGTPAMVACDLAPDSVAMLIVGMDAEFGKKATDTTTFTTESCAEMFAAVAETCRTGEPVTVKALTVGRMPDGTEVSRFHFTWSFKKRSKR